MPASVLLQWSFSVPGRNISLSDLILTRVLEEYKLSQPTRSALEFRTWRTALPSANPTPGRDTPAPQSVRLLTSITPSSPKDAEPDQEQTGWIFLEDRGGAAGSTQAAAKSTGGGGTATPLGDETRPIVLDEGGSQADAQAQQASTFDEDGFEVIDEPASAAPPAETTTNDAADIKPAAPQEAPNATGPSTTDRLQRTLAVRPVSSLLPLLQNLSSPFVLGPSKAARAAAATTAQLAPPTSLPGSLVTLTALSFPPLAAPLPPVQLTLYLPPATRAGPRGTIFLGATLLEPLVPASIHRDAAHADGGAVAAGTGRRKNEEEGIVREFLNSCVPAELEQGPGEWNKMWAAYPAASSPADDHVSAEKIRQEETRRIVHLLAQSLRQGGII